MAPSAPQGVEALGIAFRVTNEVLVVVVGGPAANEKIKPGDNNTAHFCSLIMPDGLRGEAVYEDLKEVEGRVSSAWKNWRSFGATKTTSGLPTRRLGAALNRRAAARFAS